MIQRLQDMFSDDNRIKLKISNKNISGKAPKRKFKNLILNSPCQRNSHKGKQELTKLKNENTTYLIVWDAFKTAFRGKYTA